MSFRCVDDERDISTIVPFKPNIKSFKKNLGIMDKKTLLALLSEKKFIEIAIFFKVITYYQPSKFIDNHDKFSKILFVGNIILSFLTHTHL